MESWSVAITYIDARQRRIDGVGHGLVSLSAGVHSPLVAEGMRCVPVE
ncbi:MAG: hypothetical protein WCU80_06010 [Paludibacteraceae bacterium]